MGTPINMNDLVELDVALASLTEWLQLISEHPFIRDKSAILEIVEHTRRHGIDSPYLGLVEPGEIEVLNSNYRESLLALGLVPRTRVLLDYFAEMSIATDKNLRIYAPEAFTPFAARLRQDYSEFFGSEYMPDAAVRERYAPVQHEDLEALSFSDGSFDVVFCNELFEHLPDLPRCLREVHRVLSPGGTLLATFPFAYGQQETVVRAIRENGTVQIIGEAEYHVDPVDLEGGALVFQIPGWEILDTLRNIGFSLAEFRFVSSSKRGICTADLAGALFLRAVR